MRAVRWARRLCLIGAALLAGAAMVPGLASAQEADPDAGRPGAWAGVTSAAGVHQLADTKSGLLPVAEVYRSDVPDGEGHWDAGGEARARASTFYPGLGATEGPSLATCLAHAQGAVFLPCPLPAYPFTAHAEYPSQPDASISSGQSIRQPPFDASLTSAVAHADRVSVFTDARASGYQAPGGVPPSSAVVTVESMSAVTREEFKGQVLTVSAQAVLQGVKLGGGAIAIDKITATSLSESDGAGVVRSTPKVTVEGVTVGGQPATIDEKGITIGPGGSGPFQEQLNAGARQALEQANIDVRLIGATTSAPEGGRTEGQAAGLLVYAERDLTAVPVFGGTYFASFILGNAGTQAYASPGAAVDSGVIDDVDLSGIFNDDSFGESDFADIGAVDPSLGGTDEVGTIDATDPGGTRPGPTQPVASEGGSARRVALLGGLAADRLALLYLAFTLAFTALLLGAHKMVPPRLPAGR